MGHVLVRTDEHQAAGGAVDAARREDVLVRVGGEHLLDVDQAVATLAGEEGGRQVGGGDPDMVLLEDGPDVDDGIGVLVGTGEPGDRRALGVGQHVAEGAQP